MEALLGEPGDIKEGSGNGHPFHRGGGPSLANLEEGSYAGGLCVEEGSGMGVSQYRGLDGDLRRGGVCLSGTLRDG